MKVSYPFSTPIALSDGFGPRTYRDASGKMVSDYHTGQDFKASNLTPVYAGADGVIRYAGWDTTGGGNGVCISIGNDFEEQMWHFDHYVVKTGDKVKKYQLVGYTGKSGDKSVGYHLHFGIKYKGAFINPMPYIDFNDLPNKPQLQPSVPVPIQLSNADTYTLKKGGWVSQVIQEIINVGIWSGTWESNQPLFLKLNPGGTPSGGYKPGMVVKVRETVQPAVQTATVIVQEPIQQIKNIMPQEQVDQLLADKQRDLDIANSTIQSLTNDNTNLNFELANKKKETEEGFFKMKAENDTRVKALENTNKLLQERMLKYEDPAVAHELETYDAIVKENADLKVQLNSTVPTVASVTAPLNPFDFSLLHNQVVINLEKKIGSTLFQTIKMRVSKPAVITFIVGLLDVVAKYYNEIYHTSLHGVDLLHAATYFLTTMAGAGLFAIINRGVEGYSDHKKADITVLNKENQVLETPKTIEEAILDGIPS